MTEKQIIHLNVNGETVEAHVDSETSLLAFLREELGLTGSKDGCSEGTCGACTVIVDGLAKRACLHGKCLFVPNALVSHKARGSLLAIWAWFVRRGRADIDVVRIGKVDEAGIIWVLRSSLVLKVIFLMIISFTVMEGYLIMVCVVLVSYAMLQISKNIRIKDSIHYHFLSS